MRSLAKVLVAALCLVLLAACSPHRPAPVEEQSSLQVKRQYNRDGTYHVKPGDTLYAIAFSYGLDHRDIAAWNGIASPYVIYPGQHLRLSSPAPVGSRSTGKSSGVQTSGIKSPAATTTRTHSGNASPKQAARSATSRTTAKPASPSPAVRSTSTQSPADPQSWQWPVNGRLLRGYVAGDPSRNGLDIAGSEGQPVKASAPGKVVYSGSGLIGYGELIIIKHSERMLSAYAHNRVRLVREGEQVTAGEKIAEMGRNDQNEQLLHFEIRVRGKPVNPLGFLPKK